MILRLRQHGGQVLRLAAGAGIAWLVIFTIADRLALPGAIAAALTLLVSLWRPDIGLLLVVAAAPAGQLFASSPAHVAELVAWAFLAGWLLRVWQPLSPTGWPRPLLIAVALYVACAVVSWLSLTVSNAGGIDAAALPRFTLRAFGLDHLSRTSPETETVALMLSLAASGLLLAALALVRQTPALAMRVAATTVAAMVAMALFTAAGVAQHLASRDFAGWLIYQYVTSERAARHLADVNAAGSQYVLAGLIAFAGAVLQPRRRWLWIAPIALMLPAAWLTGSRTAAVAGVAVGVALVAAARWPQHRPSRLQLAAVGTVAVVMMIAGGVILARGANEKEAAGRAVRLRVQFSETSARMIASAPVYGVGIGRYHGLSGDFMPDELRGLYGHENAHNYFAQQFAELGLVGGLLFLWLVVAAARAAWPSITAGHAAGAALLAAALAYIVTCVTGHPLLVAEAALPFWIVLGSAIGTVAHAGGPRPAWAMPATAVIALVLAVPLASAATSDRSQAPRERGYFDPERVDGRTGRWTSRHAVTYVSSAPGFLTLTVRAANRPGELPFELSTEIDGALADRRVIPSDRWTTIELPVRPRRNTTAEWRRVDLRVNRTWMRTHQEGRRMVAEPVGVMVAETRWTPARGIYEPER